jgi:hypothetical protein
MRISLSKDLVTPALAALAAYRYGREIAGKTIDGWAFPTDRDSQAKWAAAYAAARDGHWADGDPWKLKDGTFVPLTSVQVIAIALAIRSHIGSCFAVEADQAALVRADPTHDFTAAAWPSNT